VGGRSEIGLEKKERNWAQAKKKTKKILGSSKNACGSRPPNYARFLKEGEKQKR